MDYKKKLKMIEDSMTLLKKSLIEIQSSIKDLKKDASHIKCDISIFSQKIPEVLRDIKIMLRKIQKIDDLISNNSNIKDIKKEVDDNDNGVDILWFNIEEKMEYILDEIEKEI